MTDLTFDNGVTRIEFKTEAEMAAFMSGHRVGWMAARAEFDPVRRLQIAAARRGVGDFVLPRFSLFPNSLYRKADQS